MNIKITSNESKIAVFLRCFFGLCWASKLCGLNTGRVLVSQSADRWLDCGFNFGGRTKRLEDLKAKEKDIEFYVVAS